MVTLPCLLPECSQKNIGADFKMSGAPYRVRRGAKVNTAPGLIRLHWAHSLWPISQSRPSHNLNLFSYFPSYPFSSQPSPVLIEIIMRSIDVD